LRVFKKCAAQLTQA